MQPKRLNLGPCLAVLWFILAGTDTSLAQTDGNEDPATAELPDIRDAFLDERRALILEVEFGLDGTGYLVRSDVTEVAPAALDEGPELLLLVAFDRNGDPLMALDKWDPRWRFQRSEDETGEEAVYVGEGEAEFLLPFDPRIETVELYDRHLNPTGLLMTGEVWPTIESYCLQNPDDINCENFTPPNSPPEADAGGPYLGAVDTAIPLDGNASQGSGPLTFLWTADGGVFDDPTRPTPVFIATEAGIYPLTLEVCDAGACAAAESSIVVYDPSAGFVTGGGWIDSQPGSCGPAAPAGVCENDPTGRATFGFVAKYRKGAQAPEGKTAFAFQAADLRFASDSHDWLVVMGKDRAQFKGAGAVNGVDGYQFMITAYDGGKDGTDGFRIKIWNDIEVVYDSKAGADDSLSKSNTQPIGGGSIVIHTK